MSAISKHALAGAALLVGLALSGGAAQASLTIIADSAAPAAAADQPVAKATTTAGSDAMAAKAAPSHRAAKRTAPRWRVAASEPAVHSAPSRWRYNPIVHGVAY